MLNKGPTICKLPGALRLNLFLKSAPLKLCVEPSPETLTEVVIPLLKSAETDTEEILLYGFNPLFLSSCFTLASSKYLYLLDLIYLLGINVLTRKNLLLLKARC